MVGSKIVDSKIVWYPLNIEDVLEGLKQMIWANV